jgi:hypothetical protein
LMATGENSGSWGSVTNTNLGTALEQAVVGYGNPSYASDANLTLTLTDTNALQAARALVLNVTSAVSLTATRELVVPTIQKQYIVQNNTTGAQSITVKTSAGTGITVPNGRKAHLYVDGTNVIQMFDFVDINGGTIDGVTIGGSSAGAGTFTTLSATGNVTLGDASADTVSVPGTATFTAKPTVQLTSAATNTVTQVMRLDSQSSGTPAAGIGVGLEFATETAVGNTEVGATLEAVTTDVTAASEDFDLLVKLMVAGAAATEVARFKSTGLSLVTGDTYQINGVDVLSATALGAGILGTAQVFTAAQTFRAANSVRAEAASTQDAVVLAGRAGGTSSYAVTLTPATLASNSTITLPNVTDTLAVIGTAQTFTAAQTFQAANSIRAEAASTQDAVVLAGRAGGTSSYAVTLTPTTLTANRTITLPDGDITLPTGTYAVLGTAQTFTAAQTFRAANAIRSEAAATQDAIIIAGRAGGTSSYATTITPGTLTASTTLTLPIVTGTLATTANTSQTFAGSTTFSSTFTLSGTTTNIALGTSQTSGTWTAGGTAQTGAMTLGQSTGAQTLNLGTGATTNGTTKTVNIGTAGVSGSITNINIGSAVSGATGTLAINAGTAASLTSPSFTTTASTSVTLASPLVNVTPVTASQAAVFPLVVSNEPTGAWSANAGVGLSLKTSYNVSGTSTAGLEGYLRFAWDNTNSAAVFDLVANNKTFLSHFNSVSGNISTFVGIASSNPSVTSNSVFAAGKNANTYVNTSGTLSIVDLTSASQTVSIGDSAGILSNNNTGFTSTITYGSTSLSMGIEAGGINIQAPGGAVTFSRGGGDISIGQQAGYTSITTSGTFSRSSYNISIGAFAGLLTDANLGNDNTFIGHNTASTSTSIGSYNTFIGYSCGNNLSGNLDYAVVIGREGSTVSSGEVVIANNSTAELIHTTISGASHSVVTWNQNNATTFRDTNGISFYDTELKVVDNTDNTKILQFECSGITTATTRTLTVPNASGTIALLSGTQSFSGSTTFSSTFTLSGTTTNISLGTSQSSGTWTAGGTAQTGTMTLGRSTGAQTVDIAVGATTSGTTKTVNIGTAGVSGSTTNINIGSAVSGATTNVTINGTATLSTPTINNGYTEEVFAVTGTTPALSPTNGSIQTWTLTANSTPTAGTWLDGQSITLMVNDGTAYTITWTSLAVTWKTNGGVAPTLNTTGYTVIQLWEVGGAIYGARVGDA